MTTTAAPLKPKRQPKGKAPAEAQVEIGRADIKRSAIEAWRKLDAVIQNELNAIQKGEKELNASTASAIVKYIETSVSLATGSEDLSPKDVGDRQRAMMEKIADRLPTFDDEDDGFKQ